MSPRVLIVSTSRRQPMAARLPHWLATSLWYSACVYRKSRRRNVRMRSLRGCSNTSCSDSGAGACSRNSSAAIALLCSTHAASVNGESSSTGLAGQRKIAYMQLGDPISECGYVAIVHDNVICRRETAGTSSLCGENVAGFLESRPIAGLQAADLHIFAAIHDQHPVDTL